MTSGGAETGSGMGGSASMVSRGTASVFLRRAICSVLREGLELVADRPCSGPLTVC